MVIITNGLCVTSAETTFASLTKMEELRVEIFEDVQEHHRFRYKTENGSHGSLQGCNSPASRNSKSGPKLKITGHQGDVKLRVTLRLKKNRNVQHVHHLCGNNCDENGAYEVIHSVDRSGSIVEISGIHVKHVGRKAAIEAVQTNFSGSAEEEKKKMEKEMCANLNEVVLCFEVWPLTSSIKPAICFSRLVKNAKGKATNKLVIKRIDRYSGFANGSEEMFLLCDKVDKDDIGVKFYDDEGWSADGSFSATDVHYQVAIVFRIPPYKDINIEKQVEVKFCLFRPSNGETSSEMRFMYRPVEDDGLKRKRAKLLTGLDFSYPYQPSTSFQLQPSTSFTNQPEPSTSFTNQPQPTTSCMYRPQSSIFSQSYQEMKPFDPMVTENTYTPSNEVNTAAVINEFANIENPFKFTTANSPEEIAQQLMQGDPFLGQKEEQPINTITPTVGLISSNTYEGTAAYNENPHGYMTEHKLFLFDESDLEFDSPIQDQKVSSSGTSKEKAGLISRGTSVDRRNVVTSAGVSAAKNDLTTDSVKVSDAEKKETPVPERPLNPDDESTVPGYELAYRLAVQTLKALREYSVSGDIRSLLVTMRHLVAIQDENGDNVIHTSLINSQNDVVQYLIDVAKSVNLDPINMANKLTQTPLHLAIYMNQPELVKYLLKNGANIDILDRQGNNPFHIVCQRGLKDVFQELKSHCKNSPLVNALNYDGFAPLHLAVQSNHLAMVKELHDFKADINIQDGTTGSTPLHLAIQQQLIPVIEYLIHNVDVDNDAQNFMGNTALHLACIASNETMISMLLNEGADTQIENADTFAQSESSDEEEKSSLPKTEVHGHRPIDLCGSNIKIKNLLQGIKTPMPRMDTKIASYRAEVPCLSQTSFDSMQCDSFMKEKDFAEANKEVRLEQTKYVPQLDSGIGDSGLGISADNDMNSVDEGTKTQLAKLLDLPGSSNWKFFSKILELDYLDYMAEQQKSPTLFLLNYIEDIDRVEFALDAMKHREGLSLIKNWRINKDLWRHDSSSSADVERLSKNIGKMNLNK